MKFVSKTDNESWLSIIEMTIPMDLLQLDALKNQTYKLMA